MAHSTGSLKQGDTALRHLKRTIAELIVGTTPTDRGAVLTGGGPGTVGLTGSGHSPATADGMSGACVTEAAA